MNRRELFRRAVAVPLAVAFPAVVAPVAGSYEWVMQAVADAPGLEYTPADWTGFASARVGNVLEIRRWGKLMCRIDMSPLSEQETRHAQKLAAEHGW